MTPTNERVVVKKVELLIHFPSDHRFSEFRDWFQSRYSPPFGTVTRRSMVPGEGTTALVEYAPGVEDQVKVAAVTWFDGSVLPQG
jgi:hypothetical protein